MQLPRRFYNPECITLENQQVMLTRPVRQSGTVFTTRLGMKNLVFIVEDNLVQQKMLKTHFEEVLGNYSIRTFLNPIDLIENLKEKPFAVVLDHFFVPGEKTGLHYLRELRKDHPSIPVIYLTVLDDDAVRAEVMSLGAEGYIVKDSASLVRLRAMLDQVHNKVFLKKSYWRNLFTDSFSNFFNMGKPEAI